MAGTHPNSEGPLLVMVTVAGVRFLDKDTIRWWVVYSNGSSESRI